MYYIISFSCFHNSHSNRSHSWSSPTVWYTECLVKVEMRDVTSIIPWATQPNLSIEISTINIYLKKERGGGKERKKEGRGKGRERKRRSKIKIKIKYQAERVVRGVSGKKGQHKKQNANLSGFNIASYPKFQTLTSFQQ